MSACQCCETQQLQAMDLPGHKPGRDHTSRFNLFNWVTVLLLTGWMAIVVAAVGFAGPANVTAVPTLEAFLRTLL